MECVVCGEQPREAWSMMCSRCGAQMRRFYNILPEDITWAEYRVWLRDVQHEEPAGLLQQQSADSLLVGKWFRSVAEGRWQQCRPTYRQRYGL